MDTDKIFENNKDIQIFFELKLLEKNLIPFILSFLDSNLDKYIEWRKTRNENPNIYIKIFRYNRITLHAAKYNNKNITYQQIQLYKDFYFFKHKMKLRYNLNRITVDRPGDILSGISFHRYKIGSIFQICIERQNIFNITITKENRFNIFQPLNNELPIFMVCLAYHQLKISSPNVILNRPITFYYTSLNSKLRRDLATSTTPGFYIKFNNKH